jgi:tetratricopeptide (TPR) repeat protein
MQALFDEASKLHQLGKLDEAEIRYREILSQQAENAVVCARLALILIRTRRAREALPLFSVAINAIPNDPELLNQAVNVASQLGENAYAEKWLRLLLELKPSEVKLVEQLAGVLIANHKEHEALELTKQLLKHNPQNAAAYNYKGMALSRLGEGDKAYKAFTKAVQINPGQIGVIRNLIIHGKGKKDVVLEQIVPQYEQRLLAGGLEPAARMNIAYVLSMYYEKRGKSTESFVYLKQGNDLNRANYTYSHEQTKQQFSNLRTGFTASFVKHIEPISIQDEAPIFILGMPRSGTTLIEQILGSHSQVQAEGELQMMRTQFEQYGDTVLGSGSASTRAESCITAVKGYLSAVRTMQTQRGDTLLPIFTDKMPYNFMLLGYIASALPNAKVIHCTRDPLETCFSIYKQNFSGSHAYTNQLDELGKYYNLYQQLMTFWKTQLPGRIYEANYEAMVNDSETEIERLLKHCGLDMETDCLMFHKNKRAVRTASVAQVRQPIYRDAMKASKPYAKELQVLSDVLSRGEGVLS